MEKMTRDEAINILENIRINVGYYFHVDAKDNYEYALRMAIEALERKRGEWIVQNGMIVCSECFASSLETNFCYNCGADMRGDDD